MDRIVKNCLIIISILIVFSVSILFIEWYGNGECTAQQTKYKDLFNGSNLVAAYVLFRHGDRTPSLMELKSFPSLVQVDHSAFSPYGTGALTNVGKKKSYLLGKNLRDRYNELISELYIREEISCTSTYIARAQMTLQLVLAGLYPPKGLQKWSKDLNWQPISYIAKPMADDEMLAGYACSQFKMLKEHIKNLPEIKQQLRGCEPLLKLFSNKTGITNYTLENLWVVNGLFQSLENIGVKLPEWLREVRHELNHLAILELETWHYTDEILKFTTGALLGNVLNDMYSISIKQDKPKLHLYSTHDGVVAGFMKAVGVYKTHQPPYSSAFSLELRKRQNGTYQVFAVYAPDVYGPPKLLQIKGCPELGCDLSLFKKLKQNIVWTLEEQKMQCVISRDVL